MQGAQADELVADAFGSPVVAAQIIQQGDLPLQRLQILVHKSLLTGTVFLCADALSARSCAVAGAVLARVRDRART